MPSKQLRQLARSMSLASIGALALHAADARAQTPAPAPAPAVSAAAGSDTDRASVLFEQGREAFVAGNLLEACPKLAESYRLDPATGTLMALALCHEQEGKLALAWAELEEALQRAQQEGRADREKYVKERMEALRPRMAGGAAAKTEPVLGAPAADPVADSGPEPAASQPAPSSLDAMRIAAYGVLGFGGESEINAEGPDTPAQDSDMLTTFGLGGHVDFPLHRNFVLGVGPALMWVNDEADEDLDVGRSMLLEADVIAKVRHPFASGSSTVEVYAAVPVGLSLMFLSDDITDPLDGTGVDITTPFGFNFGIVGGAQVLFSDGWGLIGQLGYRYHALSYALEASGTSDVDLELSYGQFQMNAGVLWAL